MPLGLTQRNQFYIGGQWVAPSGGDRDAIVDPSTEEVIGEAPLGGVADMEAAIAAAREAFDTGPWPTMSIAERVVALRRFEAAIHARAAEFKALLIAETGSTTILADTIQFQTGMDHFAYALDEALRIRPESIPLEPVANMFDPTGPETVGGGEIWLEPIGVVAAITPYNFPHFLNVGKLAPALVMGNTVVLRPSPLTPYIALALGEIADAAGLPPGVLNIVNSTLEGAELLTSDPRVDMVTFTGSDAVGSAIMQQAAPTLKRLHLELGGKSPLIVREDADVQVAAGAALYAFIHSGQGCACLTRHLVHNSLRKAYVDTLAGMLAHYKVGPAAAPDTVMGPMIRASHRERVERYIALGLDSGARLVTGGKRPTGLSKGYFVEPTVFDDVDNESRLAQEEIFGPVCAVIGFDTDDDAVRLANRSQYGLSAGIFSRDAGKGYAMAKRLQTGGVSLNGGGGKMSSALPFGGYKRSGLGREYGPHWLREFCQVKSISYRVG